MLRARFGYLPGAAILSLAFSGSAGIINSGRKGLSRPLAVDGLAVPGGEQAPTQGMPPGRSDPDLSAVRERDLSDRLHQKTTGGLVCPPCKVHGELVRLGGPSGAVRERGSNV